MAGEGKGWICLYRSIQEHWIWKDPQKLKWWLDILLLANHKDNKILLGNKLETIEKGCHHTSEIKLSKRWGVSKTTVRKFLELLESDEMIEQKKSKNGTTLKVSNYKEFQAFSDNKKTIDYTTEEPQAIPQKNHKVDTNNNENNGNNDNNENNRVCLGEFENVVLSKEQYQNLLNTHSQDFIDKYIEKLSLHMESEGRKYNSHYATIKKWINSDEEKQQAQAQQNKPKDEYGHDINNIRHKFGIVK